MIAHPFDDGDAVIVTRSVELTAAGLGTDGDGYRRTIGAAAADWPKLERAVLGPLTVPRHPLALARFGARAFRSAEAVAHAAFKTGRGRALFAGIAAHGMVPLDRPLTAGVGLALGAMCHVAGWSMPRGGAQRLTDALVSCLGPLGGEVRPSSRIDSIDALPPARAVLCDLSPKPLLRIAGHAFPAGYRRALARYRYGMGVFKMDWALSQPIPWTADGCRRAGTVHLGGTLQEIADSERAAWTGRIADRPFVLLTQPTLFDPSRAPAGHHVAWGYCHVPHGSTADMVERIERQIERFAPGFRDCVLARSVTTPAALEARNENLVGGDIAAGVADLRQWITRPTRHTYSTPVRGLYICSASTPPGVGVHGMCGYYAARRALEERFG
jgi:phytoene dehydrogenase-like protein